VKVVVAGQAQPYLQVANGTTAMMVLGNILQSVCPPSIPIGKDLVNKGIFQPIYSRGRLLPSQYVKTSLTVSVNSTNISSDCYSQNGAP
jgi:hypothetical protein